MSRSIKKYAIVKGNTGRWYNKRIRRTVRRAIRDIKNLSDILSYYIPNNKEIIDQWDICDYKIDFSKYRQCPRLKRIFKVESEEDYNNFCNKLKRK